MCADVEPPVSLQNFVTLFHQQETCLGPDSPGSSSLSPASRALALADKRYEEAMRVDGGGNESANSEGTMVYVLLLLYVSLC